MVSDDAWVTVASPRDDLEAALLRGLLEGAGIATQVRPRGFRTLAGALGGANLPGHIDLLVRPDDAYEARMLLSAKPEDPEAKPGTPNS